MKLTLIVAAVATTAFSLAQSRPPAWDTPQDPIRLYGNSYYVGTRGLTAVLITSEQGHVVIDGTTPESGAAVLRNIRAAGFRVEDVKLLLNSHAHYDHAGGLASLQRASGARATARAWSARVLARGSSLPDDPQHGVLPTLEPLKNIDVVEDGEVVRVGPLALTAHATGGHTPGGTSWSWRSCEDGRCVDMVYADSISAVSADTFFFTRTQQYPGAIADFERAFARLSQIPCDILLTPHPEASDLWGRVERREATGSSEALIGKDTCRRYAETGRRGLADRIAREKQATQSPKVRGS